MRIKTFAVIDTNVLVSAIISQSEYPYDILRMIEAGNVIPVFDRRMILEYKDVFGHEELKISAQDAENALRLILEKGILIHDVEKAKKTLLDNDDVPFFEIKEYSEDRSILTPKMLIQLLYQMERFIKREIDYESVIRETLQGEKYSSKKELL